MAKLFEQVKNPTTAIIALALAGFLFLSTTVVTQQQTIQAQQTAVAAKVFEHDQKTEALVSALQELLKEEKYANAVSLKFLEEICYINAKNDGQRQRCRDLR